MITELSIITGSEEQTIMLGSIIARALRPDDVILLVGELGSGKTRLAKGIISAATGVDTAEVVSPTFTLINRFDGPFPVYHADFYRLETDHWDDLGLDDILDSGAALIVEWAEKIADMFQDPLTILVNYRDLESSRELRLRWLKDGSWERRLSNCAQLACLIPEPANERDSDAP